MRYQVIESKIWYDEHFVRYTPMQQRLFLYLLTCPHGNFIGIFVLKPEYVVGDLGISTDEYLSDLKALKHSVKYDDSTHIIWIRKLLRYGTSNKPLNEKQRAGATKLISELPKSILIKNFAEYNKHILGDVSIPDMIGVSTGISDTTEYPYEITETEEETEEEKEREAESNLDSEYNAEGNHDTANKSTSYLSDTISNSISHNQNSSLEENQYNKEIKELEERKEKLRDIVTSAEEEEIRNPSRENYKRWLKAVEDVQLVSKMILDKKYKHRTK